MQGLSINFLKTRCSFGAISSAHFFHTRASTPSGPASLFGFRDRRTSSIESAVIVTSVMRLFVRSGMVRAAEVGSSFVNTEW